MLAHSKQDHSMMLVSDMMCFIGRMNICMMCMVRMPCMTGWSCSPLRC